MTQTRSPKRIASIQTQSRDLALLRGLFESRIMSLEHAAVLHFDGKREAAKKRIQKLKAAKLIKERPRRASEPSVLTLTRTAFKLLHEHGQLSDYPKLGMKTLEKRATVSDLTVRHELQVMDVKAAMVAAINKTKRFTIAEFSTWPRLYQFKSRRSIADPTQSGNLLVKPDGFIRIHEEESDGGLSEHTFFLEVDRSTERQTILRERALYYLDYYRRGGLAVRNGQSPDAYKEFPFRVLFVLPTIERRDNTAQGLLENRPATLTQTWLTTFPEITTDPLGEIWVRPKDYRDTIHDRFFANSIGNGSTREQKSRARQTEPAVRKRSLL